MKKQVGVVDATPSKRLYLSIIADYDLNKGICELIDNALDIWIKNEKTNKLKIDITLDNTQQTITVKDNAGGITKEELSGVVGPGHTSNTEKGETIGIFGVGTKRAVVALAQDIKIKTRKRDEISYQVEFDDDWLLNNDDWHLPVFEISEIDLGTTVIELTRLRIKLDDEKLDSLRKHLGSTYGRFLEHHNLKIALNAIDVASITFEKWAYPPGFEPRRYTGEIKTSTGEAVRIDAIAGLTTESNPSGGEWGVYVFCNERLIASGLKTFDVGFTSGLAGKPHPDISLMRLLLFINGSARLMPWNSSKSDINTSNEVFLSIRNWLVQVVKDYSSLSRRFNKLEGGWPENVFKYDTGHVRNEAISDFRTANTSYLPPLPDFKPRLPDKIKNANKAIVQTKPWTRGLYESILAVDVILKKGFEQKNRICLIILDSTLEIAFKEYLVNESGIAFSDERLQKIFKDRTQVHQEVKQNAFRKISASDWTTIEYFYKMRCDLIHRRSTATIPDEDLNRYKDLVTKILQRLFGLNLSFD